MGARATPPASGPHASEPKGLRWAAEKPQMTMARGPRGLGRGPPTPTPTRPPPPTRPPRALGRRTWGDVQIRPSSACRSRELVTRSRDTRGPRTGAGTSGPVTGVRDTRECLIDTGTPGTSDRSGPSCHETSRDLGPVGSGEDLSPKGVEGLKEVLPVRGTPGVLRSSWASEDF